MSTTKLYVQRWKNHRQARKSVRIVEKTISVNWMETRDATKLAICFSCVSHGMGRPLLLRSHTTASPRTAARKWNEKLCETSVHADYNHLWSMNMMIIIIMIHSLAYCGSQAVCFLFIFFSCVTSLRSCDTRIPKHTRRKFASLNWQCPCWMSRFRFVYIRRASFGMDLGVAGDGNSLSSSTSFEPFFLCPSLGCRFNIHAHSRGTLVDGSITFALIARISLFGLCAVHIEPDIENPKQTFQWHVLRIDTSTVFSAMRTMWNDLAGHLLRTFALDYPFMRILIFSNERNSLLIYKSTLHTNQRHPFNLCYYYYLVFTF